MIALEIITLLLENPNKDSVEIAIGFLKEVGQKLLEVCPKGLTGNKIRSVSPTFFWALFHYGVNGRMEHFKIKFFSLISAVFDQLRTISHEADIEPEDRLRVDQMMVTMFAIRKDNFKDYPSFMKELDLVEEGEQFTHPLELAGEYQPEDILSTCGDFYHPLLISCSNLDEIFHFKLIDWLIDRLSDWMIDWLSDWMIVRMIDWLSD